MRSVGWTSTTHDWSAAVDERHLATVRDAADAYAPGGVLHLLHEVLAYVADEAQALGAGAARCEVTLSPDGSVAVRDHGRGTDTRVDDRGRVIRKPVMATKDLRFFDDAAAEVLPDGRPRRGMSVVAALSDWLVHENRRLDGAWQQRYERGIPVTDLVELPPDRTTGTTVVFLAAQRLLPLGAGDLSRLLTSAWPGLALAVTDRRQARRGSAST